MRKELLHWQPGLGGVIGIRAVIAAAVGPPVEPSIIEVRFAGVKHRSAFGQYRMPEPLMHQSFPGS